MKKKKEKRLMLFLVVILAITVGYALLSQTLNINGTAKIDKTTWKIIWNNVQVTEGSVEGAQVIQEPTIDTNKTAVEYSINLKQPKEFYEFTIDAVNEGTIDGMIDVISNKIYESDGVTEVNPTLSYLGYKVTYSDGEELAQNQLLSAGSTETYKVRIEFKDVEASQLPSNADRTLKFKFSVDYIQADENATSPIPGVLPRYDENGGCATINTDSSGGGGNATMSGLTLMMKNATQGEDDPSWFTDTAEHQSQAGVYTRKGTSNDKYPIYYYRGAYASVNNNLIFNNYCWKIVRTTATGGVRIIYNGPASNGECTTQTGDTTRITTAKFNTSYNEAKYVKYVYDDNGTPTDSNLKIVLDNWYNTNMTNVDNKIETSVYCNDTSEITTEEKSAFDIPTSWNYYCTNKRAMNGTPTTLCSKKSDAYKLKVGFLTVDEEALAGRSWNNGMQDYLYNNIYYWLGSPSGFNGSSAYVFFVRYAYMDDDYVNSTYGVRPVVSLVTNTSYSGTGTRTDPFVVS